MGVDAGRFEFPQGAFDDYFAARDGRRYAAATAVLETSSRVGASGFTRDDVDLPDVSPLELDFSDVKIGSRDPHLIELVDRECRRRVGVFKRKKDFEGLFLEIMSIAQRANETMRTGRLDQAPLPMSEVKEKVARWVAWYYDRHKPYLAGGKRGDRERSLGAKRGLGRAVLANVARASLRRAEIAERSTMESAEAISASMGLSDGTVRRVRARVAPKQQRVSERRERVRDLKRRHLKSNAEIASLVGVSERTVERDLAS